MNIPNALTISRIVLAPVFMILFLIDNIYTKTLALLIFVLAVFTDLYDGYLARKNGMITGFGKFMDPLADKILVSTALVCFVALDYVKTWMVLTIIVREFFITGFRTLAAYRGFVIAPTILAQWKTVSQMFIITLILLYTVLKTLLIPLGYNWSIFTSPWTNRTFDIAMFVVMVLTVVTGVIYLIKNASLLKGVLK